MDTSVEISEVEKQTLRNLEASVEALTTATVTTETLQTLLNIAVRLTTLLPELLPGCVRLTTMFVKELIRRKAQRLADALQI